MLKYIVIAVISFLPQLLFAQTPVPFKKEVLPCIQSWDLYFKQNRIVNLETWDDSVFIHLSVLEDCGFTSECDSFTVDLRDDTLFLDVEYITTHVNEPCPSTMCACCFELLYRLPGECLNFNQIYYQGQNITTLIGEYRYRQEPTFEIYQSDTINYTDQYGIKRGLWLMFKDSLKTKIVGELLYYQNEHSGYFYNYDSHGNKKQENFIVYYYDKYYRLMVNFKRFFEKGQLITEEKNYEEGITSHQIIRNPKGFLEKIIIKKEDGTELIIE